MRKFSSRGYFWATNHKTLGISGGFGDRGSFFRLVTYLLPMVGRWIKVWNIVWKKEHLSIKIEPYRVLLIRRLEPARNFLARHVKNDDNYSNIFYWNLILTRFDFIKFGKWFVQRKTFTRARHVFSAKSKALWLVLDFNDLLFQITCIWLRNIKCRPALAWIIGRWDLF